MITTYTHDSDALKSSIIIDRCYVSRPTGQNADNSVEYKALWDTGAMFTCVSERMVSSLGLTATDFIDVSGANNVPFKVPVYDVNIKIDTYAIPFKRVIGLPMNPDFDIIIGMDIITKGDTAITNFDGHTVISFRTPSLGKIDFTRH